MRPTPSLRGALFAAALSLASASAACARVVVREGGATGTSTGLRVHPPRPYLWVAAPATPVPDPAPRRSAELLLLPDLDRPQWIRMRAGLGVASASVTLSHGMLAAFSEEADGEAAEGLAALGDAAAEALDALARRVAARAAGAEPGYASGTLFELRSRGDGGLDLVPVPKDAAARLLARVALEPARASLRLGR